MSEFTIEPYVATVVFSKDEMDAMRRTASTDLFDRAVADARARMELYPGHRYVPPKVSFSPMPQNSFSDGIDIAVKMAIMLSMRG